MLFGIYHMTEANLNYVQEIELNIDKNQSLQGMKTLWRTPGTTPTGTQIE